MPKILKVLWYQVQWERNQYKEQTLLHLQKICKWQIHRSWLILQTAYLREICLKTYHQTSVKWAKWTQWKVMYLNKSQSNHNLMQIQSQSQIQRTRLEEEQFLCIFLQLPWIQSKQRMSQPHLMKHSRHPRSKIRANTVIKKNWNIISCFKH